MDHNSFRHFFFNDTATTEIYTLSLHDALPISEEQMAQAEIQLKQQELQIKAADIQVKQQKIQQVAAADAVDAELKMAELQLEREQKRAVAIGAT